MKTLKKVMILFLGISITACSSSGLKLKQDDDKGDIKELRYEYTGEIIKVSLKEFISNLDDLDLDKLIDSTEIQANTKMFDEDQEEVNETSVLKIEKEEQEYYFTAKDLGSYVVKMNYNKKEYLISVIIEDTTAPVFENESDQIEIADGSNKDDILSQINTKDLTPVTIEIDDSNINYGEAGEYTSNITATDTSNNKSQKEFKIRIKEKEVPTEEKPSEQGNSVVTNIPNTGSSWSAPQTPPTGGGGGPTTPPTGGGNGGGTPSSCTGNFKNIGNSGQIFINDTLAWKWGWAQAIDPESNWFSKGYHVLPVWDDCGNQSYTVEFY